MAAVLTEPDAAKAATMTGAGELTCISFPITKVEETADGDVVVTGTASDGSVDSDRQIVDPEWAQKGPGGLQDWYDTFKNVRVQHQAQRDPAGKGIDVQFLNDGRSVVKSLVVEPVAKELVRKGILSAYSVGIANPVIVRDPAAPGGRIKGGQIVEISLVDRPANKNCGIQLVKMASDGTPEFTGKVFGATGGVITKDAAATVGEEQPAALVQPKTPKTVTVDLPKNMSLSIKPSDLAKLANLRRGLEEQQTRMAAPEAVKPLGEALKTASPEVAAKYAGKAAAEAAAEDSPELAAVKAVEAEVYKRDIDTATRRELAGEGKALPNLSYPIENTEDLGNAAHLARTGHGDVADAKRLIARRAEELGVKNPLKGGKKKTKAAEPEVTKCGTCGGDGMMDGKPCPDCKPAKKPKKAKVKAAAEPDAAKGKGKLRAICPGCGAKQNPQHQHCPECGGKLPDRALLTVKKNHDFVCLGCGKNLDKGERHCPECGKENPGYLPEADRKIPANEDKAAKGGKPKKGGKKGKPFGDRQAPPFGVKDEDGDDDGKVKKAARVIKKKKGKTPGAASGAVGQTGEYSVPPHREPDGGAMEAFEADAGMQDGDGGDKQPIIDVGHSDKTADPEMAAAVHLKALGVPQDMGALHALTCPAYSPDDVAKAFPAASFTGIDAGEWQRADFEKAASGPLEDMAQLMVLGNAATVLKTAPLDLLAGLRVEAHKAFRDANPGPSTFPTPGELSPQRFHRPYISEGHAAASPGHDAPHSVKLPPAGGIAAGQFTRGYLDAGHASESPSSQHTPGPLNTPAPTGAPTGLPGEQYAAHFNRDGVAHAVSAMHDHISRIFPDICPMEHNLGDYSHPVPTPTGGVKPAPGARKAKKAAKAKARKAAKVKRKAAKAAKVKAARLAGKVMKGKMTVNKARAKMGYEPLPEEATTPVEETPSQEDVLKAAIAEATAPLAAALKKANKTAARQGKQLRQVRKTANAIASQPDTSNAPFRGTALTKSSAPAVQAPTPAGIAEQAQLEKMRLLQQEAFYSNDPGVRVAATAELNHLLGIGSTMHPQTQNIPMRQ